MSRNSRVRDVRTDIETPLFLRPVEQARPAVFITRRAFREKKPKKSHQKNIIEKTLRRFLFVYFRNETTLVLLFNIVQAKFNDTDNYEVRPCKNVISVPFKKK